MHNFHVGFKADDMYSETIAYFPGPLPASYVACSTEKRIHNLMWVM